jgi:nicotinamide-nucleotide amidase
MEELVASLAESLSARGGMLVTAESCTGGWVAKQVTDRAGSSAWFDRGFVTYSNDAKVDMLGVSMATLDQHGAVSEAVVAEMALGALAHSRGSLAVAVSGIAGPGGGAAHKPVGTVWFAWAMSDGGVVTKVYHFEGDRDAVRRQAVEVALRGLIRMIEHG